MMVDPKRKALSERIARDVSDYASRGGKIIKLKNGEFGKNYGKASKKMRSRKQHS